MVRSKSEISTRLGSVLIRGAFLSIGLWSFSVFSLVILGKKIYPWPFSLTLYSEGNGVYGFGAGLGMLLLAATPVSMLAVFIVHSISQKNIRSILVGTSVMMVVFTALIMAMMG